VFGNVSEFVEKKKNKKKRKNKNGSNANANANVVEPKEELNRSVHSSNSDTEDYPSSSLKLNSIEEMWEYLTHLTKSKYN